MSPLAGGFKTWASVISCNSQEQKKAGEGPTWYIEPFSARRDKSVARIERWLSLDCVLFGGRPAVENQCQHRRQA